MFRFHLLARLLLLGFSVLSWAYGIASYSPFAFDMFIRPRLLPAVADFAAWHHLWVLGGVLPVAFSLSADVRSIARGQAGVQTARWLALVFIIVFGLVGARLVTTPYVPTLTNDARSLIFRARVPAAGRLDRCDRSPDRMDSSHERL